VSILQDGADTVMATAKSGKGMVFAVVDPWLYNEYIDGHNLPPRYDNLGGGKELVRWLLQQIPNDNLSSRVRATMMKTIAGGCYLAVQPPSIRMSVPVIKLAHSEQR
jgi:hypothetical protein